MRKVRLREGEGLVHVTQLLGSLIRRRIQMAQLFVLHVLSVGIFAVWFAIGHVCCCPVFLFLSSLKELLALG